MRILVTGGAGFIGSNLTKRLLAEGHEVLALDNLVTGKKENVVPFRLNGTFTFIKHDITHPFPSRVHTTPFERIYHLACPTGVPNLTRLSEEMLLTCSVGTRNLLELARRNQARLLLTSSSEIYGDPQRSPQSESYTGNVDPVGIRSPYEEGKRYAETLTSVYVKKHGVQAVIVRLFNTYGYNMATDDQRVIPRFVRAALSGEPLLVHGEGTQSRTFCFVDDTVEGLVTIMEKGKLGTVYNLGSDTQISIKNLADKILKLANSTSPIQFVTRPAHDHTSRLPNIDRVKLLGWRPHVDLDEGLRRTILALQ